MQLLVQLQETGMMIDIGDPMKNPVTLVPFDIGSGNGCLVKPYTTKGIEYYIEGNDLDQVPAQERKHL